MSPLHLDNIEALWGARKKGKSEVWGLTASGGVWYGLGMLKRTSCQIDPSILADLQNHYKGLSPSVIIRLCIQYVHETKPDLKTGETKFYLKG